MYSQQYWKFNVNDELIEDDIWQKLSYVKVCVNAQGFKCNDGFIIKELAISDPYRLVHQMYSSPFCFMSTNDIKLIRWNVKHTHKIPFFEDGLTFDNKLLNKLYGEGCEFYTKGSEMAKLLSSIFNVQFIDLDPLECPNIIVCKKCVYHEDNVVYCALRKALAYSLFVNKNVLL